MVRVFYGGQSAVPWQLEPSRDYVAVRTSSRQPISGRSPYERVSLTPETYLLLSEFDLATRFREAGVEVLQAKTPQATDELRDRARSILQAEPEVQFAGRVLVPTDAPQPVLYTENLFLKFDDDAEPEVQQTLLQQFGLTVKRPLEYARYAYFVGAAEGTGLNIFEIAEQLLQEDAVELCHPELIYPRRSRQAFSQQWHLKPTSVNGQAIDASAQVEAAWELSTGEGVTIAVIDDGVDVDHEEFRTAGKVIAPRDVSRQVDDPRPLDGDNHGTACAGVACANGQFGASGVAPNAKLIPIRLASSLGSIAEAEAFYWAARNGADVISCSWGPEDGPWWDPNDPSHQRVVRLPDSTRTAIDYAATQGRNGKGCVVLFAAGNGNESVDNDGYASYAKVIAVAACNDRGTRSAYSDYGQAVWCAFPSNDVVRETLTSGIWTTDRMGKLGYNAGSFSQGDAAGNYTNSFGGTSSACPGAAGVAALVIARNPDLSRDQVRQVLKQCCDPIDLAEGNYDAQGHSPSYGYGRLNARKAVELARPDQPSAVQVFKRVQDVPIQDFSTASLSLEVPETGAIKVLKVGVDIEHTYIGDLVVQVIPPATMGLSAILLHDRSGRGTDNLQRTYDVASTPDLGRLSGKDPQGTWTLEVSDKASQDVGRIRSFSLEVESE